ncbi:DNA mismatch repair protein MutS [Jeotgalibacillus proteolyticus]|uniref:DNA mismatch repair protein MutS n=1 Tax=Jeotgalibacillus proteolyticus TaxID=2082395 RepID=A0A2S5GG70_9BACL|nr:DNA mismatch repair protein MutS [Jeotgalibacillus proteolyticus]PPA71986.1 DNA mismatch repair protein MutS [Jeotgalibacillus proteolyticus]
MKTYTPMIQQYLKIKAEVPDAFLFFRLGDFYEMFFDDALKASRELEITLTARDGGVEEKIPMCGVPHHSAAGYIEQLIAKGFKVAICEQTEDPKQTKGVVKREIVQMITPGTVMEARSLEEKENHYIAALTGFEDGSFSIAHLDLSTGESKVTLVETLEECIHELVTIQAREIVLSSEENPEIEKMLRERNIHSFSIMDECSEEPAFKEVLLDLKQEKLTNAMCRLLHYTKLTQKRSLDHLQAAAPYQIDSFLRMDPNSKRNLELTETIRGNGKKGSLVWLLDETMTAMGGRLLRRWIDRPLINRTEINFRLSAVEGFIEAYFERQTLRDALKEVYDLERLAGRVAFGNVNARDLVQLKKSLQQVPLIQQTLTQTEHPEIGKLADKMDPCKDLAEMLEKAIIDQPPLGLKEGNYIKDGYNAELDQYRDAGRNGKTWIAELEQKERQKTGIRSLKIGYNRVFGYYIEVTKANLGALQEGMYERRQTLTNAERFITPELKEKEELILQAEEKSTELEYRLFQELREMVKNEIPRLQTLAQEVSRLDVLQCFATVSENQRYVKPEFNNDRTILIEEGRHPVIEKVMDAQEYVPNNCKMSKECEMLLITGPNMSGKSTYMRQVALTAILGQIGCFVPAEKANLPIFDRIFTRIGAADDLVSGQSTFMVEMLEARHALAHATQNSLILFDEIGRGTSTYDGMALAQAIIEHVHNKVGAKTLFSTHYHELVDLSKELEKLVNVHVAATEQDGHVVFLHKIKKGPADKSYGIHVAKLANLPSPLIERANELLKGFEAPSAKQELREQDTVGQLSLFGEVKEKKVKKQNQSRIQREVLNLDVLEMTPLEALNELYRLQKLAKTETN